LCKFHSADILRKKALPDKKKNKKYNSTKKLIFFQNLRQNWSEKSFFVHITSEEEIQNAEFRIIKKYFYKKEI
jgi:hypothetical protein